MEEKSFAETLKEKMETRGLNLDRLSEGCGVPKRYLSLIYGGDVKKLPPAPYIRGYIFKIGEVLGIDGQSLWELYKKENQLKISGTEDRLPTNRFALKQKNKTFIILGFFLLVIITYFVWRGPQLLGAPTIEVVYPPQNGITVRDSITKLNGKVSPGDKLTINQEDVILESNGQFSKDVQLEPGINTFEFGAKRFLGRETKVIRQIIYEP